MRLLSSSSWPAFCPCNELAKFSYHWHVKRDLALPTAARWVVDLSVIHKKQFFQSISLLNILTSPPFWWNWKLLFKVAFYRSFLYLSKFSEGKERQWPVDQASFLQNGKQLNGEVPPPWCGRCASKSVCCCFFTSLAPTQTTWPLPPGCGKGFSTL